MSGKESSDKKIGFSTPISYVNALTGLTTWRFRIVFVNTFDWRELKSISP